MKTLEKLLTGKRLGKLTGKIYEENQIHDMKECGVCITDEQAKDEKWIKEHHAKDLADCIMCRGCVMYHVES